MTEQELYHYGVKGMKWGVRRTPEQLSKSRAKFTAKAEKHSEKISGKTEKWASKRVQKGKGEKALAKLERKQSRGISEDAVNGMKRRTEAFDRSVERKAAKDPSYAKLSPTEKQYLQDKISGQIMAQEFSKMRLKQAAINQATDKTIERYGNKNLQDATKNEAISTVGIKIASFIISSKMTKGNVTAMREIMAVNSAEKLQRRTEELKKQLG